MLSKKALNIKPSPTMAIDGKAKEMKSQGLDVIGFGAGEPDFDTPLHIREAAIDAINNGHTRYTAAAGTVELKEAICSKFKRENGLTYTPAQIVVSNGAKHSLDNVFCALLDPGDEVLIPAPFWVSYPEMVKLNDGIPVILETNEENRFKVELEMLKKACSPKTKALVLNNPSNPTGQLYPAEDLKEIGEFCVANNIFIISDEVYEKLVYRGNSCVSIATFSEAIKEQTIVVNAVSKTYAMTGWRIGYTASGPEIAAAMAAIQSQTTSNPNAIAQKAAEQALSGPQDSVAEMLKAFDERRLFMYEKINSIEGLSALEPLGAFYLFANMSGTVGKKFEGKEIKNSDDFASLLLESKLVALVPGTGFGAPMHIRLSFATSLNNIKEGLDRVNAFVEELA